MQLDPEPATTRDRPWLVFAVLAVGVAAFTLLQSLVVPVLARIQAEYATDQSTVTWVLTAYLLAASVATPLMGRLGDLVGRKRVLVATLALLSVGSMMAALAPSIGWLIAARVVQGVGGATLPLSFGIIRDVFPERSRTQALSVLASLAAVGFGIGIVLGGAIVDGLGFAWLFWLPMIGTGLAAVSAQVWVPESTSRGQERGRLPLVPATLLSGSLVCLLLAVSQGAPWGWDDPVIHALFSGALILGLVWVWTDLRARVPLIDMQIMRRRGIWTANVVSGAVGFGMFSAFAFIPQFLQTPESTGYGFGASVAESGRIVGPSALISFAIGFTTAWLIRTVGIRAVIVAGTLLNAVAFCSLTLFHDHTWQLYVAICIQGVGGGLVFSSMANLVTAAAPADQTGVANGMNYNIRVVGGAVGTAVMAAIVSAHLGDDGYSSVQGYTISFAVMAAAMVVAAVAACWIPDIRRPAVAGIDNADAGVLVSPPRPAV